MTLPTAVCLIARDGKSGHWLAAVVAGLHVIPAGLHASQRQAFAAADLRRTFLVRDGQVRKPADARERRAAEDAAGLVFDAFTAWHIENGKPDIGGVPDVWELIGSAPAA
jgi:hypothetical protein